MSLHEEYEDFSFNDFNYEEEVKDLSHRKKVRRLLEERLERKRLKSEFKDEFDEFDADFNWDEIEK